METLLGFLSGGKKNKTKQSKKKHLVNPFTAQGFLHWRVKSSGVRQSKIYKYPEGAHGS